MISLDDFVERLCRLGSDRGPRSFPRRRRDRQVLMKSIIMGFDSGLEYAETEVNVMLRRWRDEIAPAIDIDHVTLRRHLVDCGQLERTADGGRYRVGFPPSPILFDLEIDSLDLWSTVSAYRDYDEERKRASRQAATNDRA